MILSNKFKTKLKKIINKKFKKYLMTVLTIPKN